MNLNSLDIDTWLSQHNRKPAWIYKFSNKHDSVWC